MKRYELSLSDYWMVIRKRKLIIILCFVGIIVGSALFSLQMTPIYTATTSIQVAERTSTVEIIPEITMPMQRFIDAVESQANTIVSLSVMEQVAFRLGLIDENSSREEVLKVCKELQSQIRTKVLKSTNIIYITVKDPSPEMAAAIANTTAEAYIDVEFESRAKQARSVLNDIEKQLKSVTARLKRAEKEILELKSSGEATGIAVLLTDKLADLEAKKADLLTVYTEKHPELIGINKQIEAIRKRLKTMPAGEIAYARANREVKALGGVYGNLTGRLSSARIAEARNVEEVKVLDPAAVPESPSTPNIPLNIGLGAGIGIILGFLVAFLVENLDTSLIAIDAIEELTKLPVLGIIPFVKWEKKGKKKDKKTKKKSTGVGKELIIHEDKESVGMEAFKSLRTNICLKMEKEDKKLILVTSSTPKEGKTVIAANLAVVMAQHQLKTLLIDTDLRRPRLHHLFGLEKGPGFSDIIMESATMEDATRNITDVLAGGAGWMDVLKVRNLDYLHIITCGSHIDDPTELINRESTKIVLEKFRSQYDVVLFDSPPVLLVSDPILLGRMADATLLVYKVAKTPKNALLRVQELLNDSDAGLMGIILNTTKPQIYYNPSYKYEPYKYYKHYYHKTTTGKGEK